MITLIDVNVVASLLVSLVAEGNDQNTLMTSHERINWFHKKNCMILQI
jgi:hypothetical protein